MTKTATKTIISSRKGNLTTERKIVIRPGENVMSREKADTLKDSKAFALWRRLGWVKVKPPAKETPDLTDELDGGDESGTDKPVSAKEAIAFVADCSDVDVLEKMLEGEDRVTVKNALEKRLESLEEAAEGDGDGGDSSEDAGDEGDEGDESVDGAEG